MIVEPDFLDHWKTRLLVQRLSDEAAPLMVIRLWAHCQSRKRWQFDGMTDEILAAICRSNVEGDVLKTHLRDCGFIEIENGSVTVHDWEVSNRLLVSAWNNGTKGGRPIQSSNKAKTERKPNDNQSDNRQVTSPSSLSLISISTLKEGVRGRFEEWVVVRKGMGKAPKDWVVMFNEQIKWLLEFPEKLQLEILSASIRNNWQGLHEPKQNSASHNSNPDRPMSTFELDKKIKAIEEELGRTNWRKDEPEIKLERSRLNARKRELQKLMTL